MKEPQHAGDLVRHLVQKVARSRTRSALEQALDASLAPDQRGHCQVAGFRDGKLTIEVDSAPLFAELSGFRRDQLRLRINELLNEQKVAQLTFRLGGTAHV